MQIKITLIGDLHYKKRMYPASVEHLRSILKRAKNDGSDAVVHLGDFSNDYIGSPELFEAYLNNEEGLRVFGVIGNHELESADNSLEFVIPRLSNCTDSLIYGADGGRTPYYYCDFECFRLIFLDTNYSIDPAGAYEHNRTASWGAPRENVKHDSLGTEQLGWLKSVVDSAAEEGRKCIIFSHASFCPEWKSSPDADKAREIFRSANEKRKGTVLLAVNGHYHTCHSVISEGILYFDCPAAINALWRSEKFDPYSEEDPENPIFTFDFVDYDKNGKRIGSCSMPYSKIRMGAQSLFFKSPLSATLTVSDNGRIEIRGSRTEVDFGRADRRDFTIFSEIPDFCADPSSLQ